MRDDGSDLADCTAAAKAGDPVTALAMGLAARRSAEARGDHGSAAEAALAVAWACFQVGEVEMGLGHGEEARRLFGTLGLAAREVVAQAVVAWLLLETGLTEAAIEAALAAVGAAEPLGAAEAPGALEAESWAANVLAVVFWSCKQIDRADTLSLRALALARRHGNPQLVAWWLINLAGIRSEAGYRHAGLGEEAEARAALDDALAINGEALAITAPGGAHPDPWCARLALCNAAEYEVARGGLDAAEAHLARWEELPLEPGVRALAHFLYTRSSLLVRQGRGAEALPVCDRALALARESRNTDSRAHALRIMSEIQESLGRFDLALALFKQFHDTQATLAAEQVQRRVRLAELHYEIDRLKLRADELTQTSRIDALTGLGNRRLLDETLDRLRHAAQPFQIAVLDLDHFKSINDRFSHALGDEVLRRVGALLGAAVRGGDVAARMGGEEFVLVLPGTEDDEALAVCRRVQAMLSALDWREVHPALRVTASIGLASRDEAIDPVGVMALADERLYAAKRAGRDRIVAVAEGDGHRRVRAGGRPAAEALN